MRGLSLVELMVALALGLILMAGALNLFVGTRQSQKSLEMLGDVQESGRIAANIMGYAVRMAGSLGLTYPLSPVKVTSVTGLKPNITNNCFNATNQAFDWATALAMPPSGETTPALFGEDNVPSRGPQVFTNCGLSDVQPGSDILAATYIDPDTEVLTADPNNPTALNPVLDSLLSQNGLFFLSGASGGVIFQCRNTSGRNCANALLNCSAGVSRVDCARQLTNNSAVTAFYRVRTQTFYIRSWSAAQGDGIPTLMRARISNGAVITEPLVEGIANLKVTYGIDNNDDNYPDQFKTAAQMPRLYSATGLATDWSKIKAIKLDILTRSITTDPRRGSGTQTFYAGDANISIPQKNLARVFSTTVTARNTRAYGG